MQGFLTGGLAPGSYVCLQGDNTWLPAADVPSFRRVIKSASVPTLRPVELSFDDETPTQLRATPPPPPPWAALALAPAPTPVVVRATAPAPMPEAAPAAAPDPILPPLPVVASLSSAPPPVSASNPRSVQHRPSFLHAALMSAALGGVLGACAWLIHDGMRDEVPAATESAARAEQATESGPGQPEVTSAPAGAAPLPSELAALPAHRLCRSPQGEPSRICSWVRDLAAGRPAERIGLVELQRILADEDVFQAELAVLGRPDEKGRLPVRLFGEYGYCFRGARPVRNEPRLVAWVERRPGTVRGNDRACVILEEALFAERLIELSRRQGDADAPVIAARILQELSLPAPESY